MRIDRVSTRKHPTMQPSRKKPSARLLVWAVALAAVLTLAACQDNSRLPPPVPKVPQPKAAVLVPAVALVQTLLVVA